MTKEGPCSYDRAYTQTNEVTTMQEVLQRTCEKCERAIGHESCAGDHLFGCPLNLEEPVAQQEMLLFPELLLEHVAVLSDT